MEFRQAKETIKRLGLNRHHNPIVKGVTLEDKKELVEFAVLAIKTGLSYRGPLYRVTIFIIKNDGSFAMMFNDSRGMQVSGELDSGFVARYAEAITKEDCIVIYETENERYKVIGKN